MIDILQYLLHNPAETGAAIGALIGAAIATGLTTYQLGVSRERRRRSDPPSNNDTKDSDNGS